MDSHFDDFTSLEMTAKNAVNRRHFIGGSDARIIMAGDEAALVRLWKEKRGEAEPEDLSDNLIVQLGVATFAQWLQWVRFAKMTRAARQLYRYYMFNLSLSLLHVGKLR